MDQILFRPNPWVEEEETEVSPSPDLPPYAETLERWMQTEKPYLNKDFRLTDLQRILPLNRTYLSQLINTAFGCTFYQYVTNYRIKEAKRLMREQPEMKVSDVSDRCGFSSPTVFGRTFARETGLTPSEWAAQYLS